MEETKRINSSQTPPLHTTYTCARIALTLITKLNTFELWGSRLVQEPYQLTFCWLDHSCWQWWAIRSKVINRQVHSLCFALTRHDHNYIGCWVDDRQSECDPLWWGLRGISDKTYPLIFHIKHGMVREQWGNMAIRAHSKKNEVKFGAVTNIRDTDHPCFHQLSDVKLILISSLLCWQWIVNRMHVTGNYRNLL